MKRLKRREEGLSVSTVNITCSSETRGDHGGSGVFQKPVILYKKQQKNPRPKRSEGLNFKAGNITNENHVGSKTGVDLFRPEKPPKSVVTQPRRPNRRKRCDYVKSNQIDLSSQKGETLRKLKLRIKTLSMSKSLIEGSCSPLYYLKHIFKKVKYADTWILQKISNLLVGGLIITSHPVGTSLSKNVQYVVASTSPVIVKQIVSCLPFWPTSYTMPVLRDIMFLLKFVGTRHRSLRL